MSRSRVESVQTPDGSFDLTVWLPDAGTGPGLLLIQEIYGVSDYIRAVGEDLAALGYVVAAPDLFWRIKPGYQAAHDEAGLAESLELSSRFDAELGVADAAAALEQPAVAARGRRRHRRDRVLPRRIHRLLPRGAGWVDAVISFYGSAVPGHLEMLEQIDAPLQFHFGGSDAVHPARPGRRGRAGRGGAGQRRDPRRRGRRARLP